MMTLSDAPPVWVRAIYATLQWVDYHPLYLLPRRLRDYRQTLWDDGCGCKGCQARRENGLQRPRRWGGTR